MSLIERTVNTMLGSLSANHPYSTSISSRMTLPSTYACDLGNYRNDTHLDPHGKRIASSWNPEFGQTQCMSTASLDLPTSVKEEPAGDYMPSIDVLEAIEKLGLTRNYPLAASVDALAAFAARGRIEDLKRARWYLDYLITREASSAQS